MHITHFIQLKAEWHTCRLVVGPSREETMNFGRSRFPHPEEETQNALTQTVHHSGRKGLSLGPYQICKILGPSVTHCCPRGETPPSSSLLLLLRVWDEVTLARHHQTQGSLIEKESWTDLTTKKAQCHPHCFVICQSGTSSHISVHYDNLRWWCCNHHIHCKDLGRIHFLSGIKNDSDQPHGGTTISIFVCKTESFLTPQHPLFSFNFKFIHSCWPSLLYHIQYHLYEIYSAWNIQTKDFYSCYS